MREILIGLVAVAVVALLQGLFHTLGFLSERKHEELLRRMRDERGGGEAARVSLLRRGKLARSAWLTNLMSALPNADRFERLMQQAQVPITVAQLLGYSLLLAILTGIVGMVVGGTVLGVGFAVASFVAPTLFILGKRSKRSRKLSEQLPDALDMMARSLRAGHALPSTFQLVAREMPEPVCEEFGIAFEEQNLGASFDYAVMQMAKRAPNNGDLKIFAVSVVVQKETGGNLVEVIEKIADTIRARYRFYGKLRALTAEGRISGIVLGVLPIGTALFVSVMNPAYIRPLFTTPTGNGFLIYALITWAVGGLWLHRMGKVDL
jgi:tight adherence protein B